jgi:hypothetical protein
MTIDQNRATALATKLDSLNQYFDITQSTVNEISKHLGADEVTEIVEETDDTQIIDIKTLKADFRTIRDTLLETIKNGKTVIGALTASMADLDNQDPDLISAYSSLVGTVNNSLKLLTETYKNILVMQEMINKSKPKETQQGKLTVNGSVQINTVSASVDEIIRAMKNGGVTDVLELK